MEQLFRHFNLPIEIGTKINNFLLYFREYNKVVKELESSQMLAPPFSMNTFLPHDYELCHTPKTLFALHKSFYECKCGTAWPYCMKGKFIYPRKKHPVFLSNWKVPLALLPPSYMSKDYN